MHNTYRNVSVVDKKVDIVIPAAGLGTRYKQDIPKALLKTGSETILSRIISSVYKKRWVKSINCVYGFQKEKIEKQIDNCNLIYNSLYEKHNVCHSIKQGIDSLLSNRILIIYGDLVYDKNLFSRLKFNESCILFSETEQGEIGVNLNNDYINSIGWNLPHAWSHIMFLQNKELQIARELLSDSRSFNWFGFELINAIIRRGGSFKAIKHKYRINDVDTRSEYSKTLKKFESLF